MKNLYIKIFLFLTVISSFAFLLPGNPAGTARKNIVLQFVAINGFGNNLYLDNISIGKRRNFDIGVSAVNNIKKDTTFYPLAGAVTIQPEINITNFGLIQATNFLSVVRIPELGYLSYDTVPSLNSGQTYFSLHDSLDIPVDLQFTIVSYIINPFDSLHTNDTLIQHSVFLSGAPKKILLEEFTSATSPSSGSNNYFLDTFITSHYYNITPVKYHCGFPPPGIDSMYLADTAFVDLRRQYYFCNTVPTTIYNGKYKVSIPYARDSNLSLKYNEIISKGSPLEINVNYQNISADSGEATVNLNFLYPVNSSDLKLRTLVTERIVNYSKPIGASGEKTFYDVYRKNLTGNGTAITGTPGQQNYTFKFKKESYWNDSNICVVAFVQSDLNREVINSGKSNLLIKNIVQDLQKSNPIYRPDFTKNIFGNTYPYRIITGTDSIGYFNYENFEGPFPPVGWVINDLDGYLTFEKFTGVNGITFGGNSSLRMPFYDYANIGQKDTILCYAFDSVSHTDTISFDYAYAMYLSGYIDSLIVNISADGGQTFTNIFNKSGMQLATANSTTLPFYPYQNTQWRTFHYPLAEIIPPDNPVNIVPDKYELFQNYPNPFNPSTTIRFILKDKIYTTLKIYDLAGRLITTLVSSELERGEHFVNFNPKGLASGVYFYEINAGAYKEVKRLVYIK